jgi:hypothetical protein
MEDVPEVGAAVPMDKLARVYRKIQGRIQELTTAYENEVKELKAQQDAIKIALKDKMLDLGVKSVNTNEGMVILSTQTRYFTQDWDSFKQFMVEQDAFDLVEKRIAQKNMASFLAEHPGVVPPGLNSNSEYTISVRKART